MRNWHQLNQLASIGINWQDLGVILAQSWYNLGYVTHAAAYRLANMRVSEGGQNITRQSL
jgi:hypothetical protein